MKNELCKTFNLIDKQYKELCNLKEDLKAEQNYEFYKKLFHLLQLDFTLNSISIANEGIRIDYHHFFEVFVSWFDIPIQSMMLSGLTIFLEKTKFDVRSEEVLYSISLTCRKVLGLITPKHLSDKNLCKEVLSDLSNVLLGELSEFPGFSKLGITIDDMLETSSLKKIKYFLSDMKGNKLILSYRVRIAILFAVAMQVLSYIKNKDTEIFGTLCGVLGFASKRN